MREYRHNPLISADSSNHGNHLNGLSPVKTAPSWRCSTQPGMSDWTTLESYGIAGRAAAIALSLASFPPIECG
jgi:hypothetical protein